MPDSNWRPLGYEPSELPTAPTCDVQPIFTDELHFPNFNSDIKTMNIVFFQPRGNSLAKQLESYWRYYRTRTNISIR